MGGSSSSFLKYTPVGMATNAVQGKNPFDFNGSSNPVSLISNNPIANNPVTNTLTNNPVTNTFTGGPSSLTGGASNYLPGSNNINEITKLFDVQKTLNDSGFSNVTNQLNQLSDGTFQGLTSVQRSITDSTASLTNQISQSTNAQLAGISSIGNQLTSSTNAQLAGISSIGNQLTSSTNAQLAGLSSIGNQLTSSTNAQLLGISSIGNQLTSSTNAQLLGISNIGNQLSSSTNAQIGAISNLGNQLINSTANNTNLLSNQIGASTASQIAGISNIGNQISSSASSQMAFTEQGFNALMLGQVSQGGLLGNQLTGLQGGLNTIVNQQAEIARGVTDGIARHTSSLSDNIINTQNMGFGLVNNSINQTNALVTASSQQAQFVALSQQQMMNQLLDQIQDTRGLVNDVGQSVNSGVQNLSSNIVLIAIAGGAGFLVFMQMNNNK